MKNSRKPKIVHGVWWPMDDKTICSRERVRWSVSAPNTPSYVFSNPFLVLPYETYLMLRDRNQRLCIPCERKLLAEAVRLGVKVDKPSGKLRYSGLEMLATRLAA